MNFLPTNGLAQITRPCWKFALLARANLVAGGRGKAKLPDKRWNERLVGKAGEEGRKQTARLPSLPPPAEHFSSGLMMR